MDAPLVRLVRVAAVVALLGTCGSQLQPAAATGYSTQNFTVAAPSPQLAKEIGDAAEHWRRALALEWLGEELPAWPRKCPIKARVAPTLGAGGATSFVFDRGEVFDWRMNVQGSRERVLDSVIPHEVMHTVFASHFRQPLPRWADEGACTTVEHRSEIAKQEQMLIRFLKTRKGIPFSAMFAMKEYPQDVMPLYAQGHSLSKFLIDQRDKQTFIEFLADGMETQHWPRAVQSHYGYDNLLELQDSWLSWVRQGRPPIRPRTDVAVASASAPPAPRSEVGPRETPQATIRGQEPGSLVAQADGPITPTPREARPTSQSGETAQPAATIAWPASNGAPIQQAAQSTASATPPGPAGPASLRPASVYDASNHGGTFRR